MAAAGGFVGWCIWNIGRVFNPTIVPVGLGTRPVEAPRIDAIDQGFLGVQRRMRIALLIRALDRGGAERQLVMLAEGLARRGHDVHVLSFYGGGKLVTEMSDTGATFATVTKRGRWDMAGFLVRLVRELRRIGPDVIYSSMPAANITGALIRPLVRKPDVVWRLASSEMDLSRYHWFSALSYRVEAMLASIPGLIIANSSAGRAAALGRGYPADRMSVVVNGIQTAIFQPRRESGQAIKRAWGLDNGKWTVAQVARSDPKKGYEDFLAAAKILCDQRDDVQFVCVGVDSGDYTLRLKDEAERKGISDRMLWRGVEEDMGPVYNAMDINTLASRFGEGFPNAVGEAMACGVPCVVTEVGDSAVIVGDCGEVVAPGSPEQMAQAWTRLLARLETGGAALRDEARKRIVENFSVDRYIDETEKLLRGLR